MIASTAALVSLLLASLTAPARLPYAVTEASELAPDGLHHHEVLRIDRDFGKAEYEIVVDGWSPRANPKAIHDVRIWWVNTSLEDRRSPFDRKLRRYIDLEYLKNAPGEWTIRLRGDRKEFAFDVELDESHQAVAYAAVVTDDGSRVERCRASSGKLVARRFLGIPVGIHSMRVRCVDSHGRAHAGEIPYRKLRRGKVYGD